MGRQYFDDAVNPLEVDSAAVAAGVAEAYAANAANQAEAARFMRENGSDVGVGGHAPVGDPGRMGDADVGIDASDH
jgi:hypothetical protein